MKRRHLAFAVLLAPLTACLTAAPREDDCVNTVWNLSLNSHGIKLSRVETGCERERFGDRLANVRGGHRGRRE